jgi:3-deoxy-D-manno-octulosonate 8-phosphate phosphatase (KDO 8-P phosphatase)
MTRKLTAGELRSRARRIKLVLTDNDGVLTDTGVYYNEYGEVMKRFSIRDGMGVELLRNEGVETAIVTSETSPSVKRRAEKLHMRFLYLGVKDKKAHLPMVLQETALGLNEVAYIGDDVNDLSIIEEVGKSGLTAAPHDAIPSIRKAVHYCCRARGGNGAFRDFADWILSLRRAESRHRRRTK